MDLAPMSLLSWLCILSFDTIIQGIWSWELQVPVIGHFVADHGPLSEGRLGLDWYVREFTVPLLLFPAHRNWWHIWRVVDTWNKLILLVQLMALKMDEPKQAWIRLFFLSTRLVHSAVMWYRVGPSFKKLLQMIDFIGLKLIGGGLATPQGVMIIIGVIDFLMPQIMYESHPTYIPQLSGAITVLQMYLGISYNFSRAMVDILLPPFQQCLLHSYFGFNSFTSWFSLGARMHTSNLPCSVLHPETVSYSQLFPALHFVFYEPLLTYRGLFPWVNYIVWLRSSTCNRMRVQMS